MRATAHPAARRRRHRFRRMHRLHYWVVLTGISLATAVCVLNVFAFTSRRVDLAEATFWLVVVTALVIFNAFFLGFYMVMDGNIPVKKLKYLFPHGAVGMLSPLFYTINISLDLDQLGRPATGPELISSIVCLALLFVQFAMGKAVVRPEPLRVVRPEPEQADPPVRVRVAGGRH